MAATDAERVRIDKWLWAARFYKTRTLATEAVEGGHVQVNGVRIKPSREVRAGDRVSVSLHGVQRDLVVRALGERRGPASVAATLYEETAESLARQAAVREARHSGVEPAQARQGRPTKRERRDYDRWRPE